MSNDLIVDIPQKEVYQAFEEIMRRNLQMVVKHSNETRQMVREAEIKVQHLENALVQKDRELEELRLLLSKVQQQLWQ